ncbi:MAG: hypothetical protein AB7E37_01045 [Candidatus Altimarinota bacterium]
MENLLENIIENEKLRESIIYALKIFYENDYHSFFKDNDSKITSVHEVAISCKLGIYIFNSLKDNAFFEGKYKDFSVDMEYNKMNDKLDMKYLEGFEKTFGKTGNFRPDIIIHKRGLGGSENNLCVFEIKKGKLDKKDIYKLKNIINDGNFNYQYGIGLSEFNVDSVKISVFTNGSEKPIVVKIKVIGVYFS